MSNEWLAGLEPVLFDGATGTRLFALGWPTHEPTAAANVHAPDLVRRIASEYATVGADVLLANTFGALDERVSPIEPGSDPAPELVSRALELAREGIAASGRTPRVAVSFAPLALRRFPTNLTRLDAVLASLVDASVDAVLFETQTDVADACRAVALARNRLPEVPRFVSFTFGKDDRTLDGATPEEAARTALRAGADVLGANCSYGPARMRDVVARLANAAGRSVLAKPNAGLPDAHGVHALDARSFAEGAARLVPAGARFVGGCCGTTPDAIALLAERLGRRARDPRPTES
jgi:methionine synthase I (cobalamin-dependent)